MCESLSELFLPYGEKYVNFHSIVRLETLSPHYVKVTCLSHGAAAFDRGQGNGSVERRDGRKVVSFSRVCS